MPENENGQLSNRMGVSVIASMDVLTLTLNRNLSIVSLIYETSSNSRGFAE